MSTSLYAAMVAEAIRCGWPRTFQTDLTTHDRRSIEDPANAGRPFAWLLYERGTHLCCLDRAGSGEHGRPTLVSFVRAAQERCPRGRWYLSDGHTLRRSNFAAVLAKAKACEAKSA